MQIHLKKSLVRMQYDDNKQYVRAYNTDQEDFVTVWLCRQGFNHCIKVNCRGCASCIVCVVSRYEFEDGKLYSIKCKTCDNKFFCAFIDVSAELSY